MIRYDKKTRILVLDNKSIGYAVYMNDAGYPETLYFGRSLSDYADFDCVRRAGEFSTPRYDAASGKETGYADAFKFDAAPLEISRP